MTIHAAGIVLYDKADPKRPTYLLLRNARHRTWGFPKGHLEKGEHARQGALRETLEETGLKCEIDEEFYVEVAYEVPGKEARYGGPKVTAYYAAPASPSALQISDEHDRAEWLPLEKARETLQFDSLRELLTKVDAHVRSRGD